MIWLFCVFSWSAPFAFVCVCGGGGGVAGGRTLEHLENIIQDGSSYQMLQEVGRPRLRCSAGVQPDLVTLHSSSGTSSVRRLWRLPGNLQIHGPLKCLAERMFYKRVFMSVFEWVSFCFRQHSLGHKIQEFRYFYFCLLFNFHELLELLWTVRMGWQ